MRQRAMIAMALACDPRLLIADEPTTALDVTIQAQILDLMRELKAASGAAIILITHDLGVVAEVCDEVAVMYAGEIVERAPVDALFERRSIPTRSACSARSRGSTAAPSISPTIEGVRAGHDATPPPRLPLRAALSRSSAGRSASPRRRRSSISRPAASWSRCLKRARWSRLGAS